MFEKKKKNYNKKNRTTLLDRFNPKIHTH